MYKHHNLGERLAERQYKYMLTVRKYQVKDKVFIDELQQVIAFINRSYPSCQFMQTVYEVDPTYNQLHLHAIVYFNHKFRYSSVSRYKNFRIYWRPVFDLKGARAYLNKVVKSSKIQRHILNRNLLL